MQHPLEFYTAEKKRFELELSAIKKKLAVSSTIRLGVFLAIVFGMYFFVGNGQIMAIIGVIGVALFLYLVSRHTNLQYKRDIANTLLAINTTEISVLQGDYLSLDEGRQFINPNHFYSYDIDLFGRGSLFQYINRTATEEGKTELANRLTANTITAIKTHQEAIQELAKNPTWRQHFSAIASLVKVQHPAKDIVNWIHHYKPVFSKLVTHLPLVFSIFCDNIS